MMLHNYKVNSNLRSGHSTGNYGRGRQQRNYCPQIGKIIYKKLIPQIKINNGATSPGKIKGKIYKSIVSDKTT